MLISLLWMIQSKGILVDSRLQERKKEREKEREKGRKKERKEREGDFGVGHSLIYGKDIVFVWETPEKE